MHLFYLSRCLKEYKHTQTHTHTHTPACASMRGRAMLDPVPHSTSRTVDQTPPLTRGRGPAPSRCRRMPLGQPLGEIDLHVRQWAPVGGAIRAKVLLKEAACPQSQSPSLPRPPLAIFRPALLARRKLPPKGTMFSGAAMRGEDKFGGRKRV